jgi:hypothetical protein
LKPIRVGVTQSLDAGTTNIGVEMVVVPNMDVIRRGVLIGSIAN